MTDLRIVDAPIMPQTTITGDVKLPTGGLGNFSISLGDIVWYIVTKENLASRDYVNTSSQVVQGNLNAHIQNTSNPHNVTKEQIGLGNVSNTADADKPISNAVNSAIITATTDMATKTYVNQQDNLKADKETTYTKIETDNTFAKKASTVAGYGITDTYIKSEVDTKILNKAVNSLSLDNTDTLSLKLADNTTKTVSLTSVFTNNIEKGIDDFNVKVKQPFLGSVERSQQDKNADIINVKDLGAKGDGVTDDALAFENASKVSSFIVVPQGKYLLNTNPQITKATDWLITSGVTFIGSGNLTSSEYGIFSYLHHLGGQNDWLKTFEQGAGLSYPLTDYAAHKRLTDLKNPSDLFGAIFGAKTSNSVMPRDYFGIGGYAVNDNTQHNTRVWGGYFEGHRLNDTVGASYGIEVDIVNTAPTAIINPYYQNSKQTVGIQVASGAELAQLTQQPASAFMNIANGLNRCEKGIVFQHDSLVGTNGDGLGTGIAVALSAGHIMQWYAKNADGINVDLTASISCHATDDAANLMFNTGYSRFSNVENGTPILQITHSKDTINGMVLQQAVSGNAPTLYPVGTDSNIDLAFVAKGSGRVRFGTFTQQAGQTATGYITIKDINGMERKLLAI